MVEKTTWANNSSLEIGSNMVCAVWSSWSVRFETGRWQEMRLEKGEKGGARSQQLWMVDQEGGTSTHR